MKGSSLLYAASKLSPCNSVAGTPSSISQQGLRPQIMGKVRAEAGPPCPHQQGKGAQQAQFNLSLSLRCPRPPPSKENTGDPGPLLFCSSRDQGHSSSPGLSWGHCLNSLSFLSHFLRIAKEVYEGGARASGSWPTPGRHLAHSG